ncbi:MAG: NADH-quinone oxidoreductase subunit C [Deltaproteobacteria bacterium]|nr:NADH-quinone oxidoreductase subunit C [Deltaproteobacteria bacterium]MBW1793592.1 NADH-quinone oxidoreductase subunit C [Deltaproteobacteria bacterium]
MKGEMISVSIDTVVGETAKIKVEGYRFVTMSCAELDQTMIDILYHFDKDLELKHLRLTVLRDTPVPSVSPVYFAAFLVENEIQDLFAVRFKGLAIDYERTLYLDEEVKVTPFCKYTVEKTGWGVGSKQ